MTAGSTPEERLLAAGLSLPPLPEAKGLYRTAVRHGPVLHLSAHGPFGPDGGFTHRGTIGAGLTVAAGREAAAACALSLLASARAILGDLGSVRELLTMRGYINAAPDFESHAAVLDGASEVMSVAFGEGGKAARTAVGAAGLPFGLPVVVEAEMLLVGDR